MITDHSLDYPPPPSVLGVGRVKRAPHPPEYAARELARSNPARLLVPTQCGFNHSRSASKLDAASSSDDCTCRYAERQRTTGLPSVLSHASTESHIEAALKTDGTGPAAHAADHYRHHRPAQHKKTVARHSLLGDRHLKTNPLFWKGIGMR